ncbi:DUF6083 domain-containing protein [Kitasatospora sp. NPDC048365]|uniref:DUF6083 domain-containing protein n=1 Tax=Kitasatospora sp. NPDC048365 TaxID=3364050 RepID=UPI00371CADCC
MTSCNPPAFHWDGTRKGPKPTRALRIAPDSPSRLLRAAKAGICRYCGNPVEWSYRADDTPIPLHPAELPAPAVPPRQRWHLASGIAHPTAGGSPWCRIAHPAICPATSPADTESSPELTRLRRALALRTRRLIDRGFTLQPPTPAAPPTTDETTLTATTPQLPVVHMLHSHYLAPAPLAAIRCVAQTLRRTRCPNPVADDIDLGRWTLMPVDTAATDTPRHLTSHLTPPEMAVFQLTHLPYVTQARWRGQRCLAHASSRAADIALTQWEPFNPFLHRQHIRTELPTQPAGGSA